MNLQPVQNSSNIKAVGHDPDTREMQVQFHSGATYSYPEIRKEEFDAFMAAPSMGSHFHVHFRGREGATKVKGPDKEDDAG